VNAARAVRVSGHLFAQKVAMLVMDVLLSAGFVVFGFYTAAGALLFFVVLLAIQAPIWSTKEVIAEDAGLRVRSLRSEALIPYERIAEMRRSWFSRGIVHVELRDEGQFGRRVSFWAPWGIRGPAIELLRRRIAGG
jgi:hypothetical protein